ncbi:MAG: acyl-homoserine-lactone synthase [Paracoccus sp. (in: a-proteobacteria)]|nr:acyl-homoserine-lactone synthase [Paracoccus sp. (in: a-proteobacteria)]
MTAPLRTPLIGEIPTEADVAVEVVVLPRDMARFNLVTSFLRLRKRIFVDRMAWPLHHAEGIEFEQYDTFDTAYVIAHCNGEAVGGARLKRTDHCFGEGKVVYSYMIRDAHHGLLPGMPSNLCHEEPPVDDRTWELTRFAALPFPGLAERILETANQFLHRIGASECLFLGPPAFLRMASRLGWTPRPMGDLVGNADGRFLAFSCAVRPCLTL